MRQSLHIPLADNSQLEIKLKASSIRKAILQSQQLLDFNSSITDNIKLNKVSIVSGDNELITFFDIYVKEGYHYLTPTAKYDLR